MQGPFASESMHVPWCTSTGPCPQASGMLLSRAPHHEVHSCISTQHLCLLCASPPGHTHEHIETQPYMGTETQVPAGVSPHILASMHGCPIQAQPQSGRLHDRGMQTSGDALPRDVRERLRGNHVGRNPGKRARIRRGPQVLRIVQGVGHMQTLVLVSPVTPCP